MPGHMLVVPKRHVEHMCDLAGAERRELFDIAIELQNQVIKKLTPGCDVSQHDRPFLPQSQLKVDHLHLHILPREFDDELYVRSQIFEKGIFKELSEKECQRFTELFSRPD
jgi:diadenosine tetraphosphate (Ap4A) HIT family hydrolase